MENFNSYYIGLDTEALLNFVMSEGHKEYFEKGEIFSAEDDVPHRFGWIVNGGFRYIRTNTDGKEYNVGFSFTDEALVDYYNFLLGQPSQVNVKALTRSEVFVVTRKQFMDFQESSPANMRFIKSASEHFGSHIYRRLLSIYADSPEERYVELKMRCPAIFSILSLKEIASYLGVTPETVSHIRRKLR